MNNPARVRITEEAEHLYRVEIDDSGNSTSHRVEVPAGLAGELGWGEEREDLLVEASFLFLLEREPAGSILGEFSLEVIGRYFPDYRDEMIRRATTD